VKRLKTAVVGAGHLGRIHARLLASLEEVELVAVVDSALSQAQRVAAEHGVAALADHREVAELAEAAIVATPTVTHHAVGLDLLEAGLHVFIEKPLAPKNAEAADLVEAAQRRGRVLQVGHVERFNPAFAAAAPWLHRPQYLEAERTSGYTFRSTDIGVVFDLMIHDIDLALSLAQSPVVRIDALGVSIFGRHEDIAQARLTFANGCVANLTASRASYAASRTMRAFTASGFASLDFAAPSAKMVRPSEAFAGGAIDFEMLSAAEKQTVRERLFSDHLCLEELPLTPRNAIRDELRDFAASISLNCQPQVDGRQGLEAVVVAERVLDAIAAHRWNTDSGILCGPLAGLQAAPLALPAEATPRRRAA
jgi:predicted dehydrogenase